jgi:DeoR/GlpR family transcriptional regulator of sugar metabolism
VTGANGCTSTASITTTQDIVAPTAGITNNTVGGSTVLTCVRTAISVTATGGVSYAWDNSLGSSANASITAPGTYTVTVTGANGCTSTASITTTQDIVAPTAGITNNTVGGSTELTCVRTAISVTATGGVSYAWDNSLGSAAAASITDPGTYTVTVTGANGCTSTASITTTQDIVAPTAGITNNTVGGSTELTCVRTAISVTATGGVSYAWDNSLGSSANASITAPGTYTVTVTGANGCTSTASITTTQDIVAPTAGITNNTVGGSTVLTCVRTAISVTATGGVSYAWDNSLGSSANASITAPGTYTVTVTGANGCTSTASITVSQNIATSTGDTTAFACNSFNWHGTIYTSSATPTHTYSNVNGCDSVVTLHLTVGYANTGDTTAFACNSFNWYGTTYTSSATPTHTFTNTSGCDSVVTLHLTLGYANTGDTTAFACNSFTWYGTTYTSSATPTHTFTNTSGCDSLVTLHLTVGHTNTGDTSVYACNSFTWYGTTYTSSATPTHTFANSLGCDSVVTLHLTINQSVTSTETISSPIPVMWHGTLYSASNNTATWLGTTINGCDSTVTLDLTITCATTYGDTTAVACNSFIWHGITYTSSATPTYTYTNVGGCDSIVTLNLTINNATSSDTTASACGSFTWKGNTYQNSGNYIAFYTNANGCDSLVTLHLTINSTPPTPGAILGPIEVCSAIGVSTPTIYSIADVPGASSYVWTVPTGATIVSGQGTTSIGVTFDNTLAQTNQRIKVSSVSGFSCTNGLTSSITIYKTIPLTPYISGPTNVCEYMGLSTNAIFTCDSTSYAAYYTWTVPTGATLVSGQGTRTIEVNFSSTFNTGSIQVAAVANCGSRTPRVFSLSRPTPGTPVAITGPTSACSYLGTGQQATYTIAAVANATSYFWTVPAGVSIVSGQNTTSLVVTFSSTFTTSLIKVKAVNNCSSSSDRTLSVAAVIPTAPSSLTGPTNGCYYVNTNIIATYICRKSTNATSYSWTLPPGVVLVSHPAGTGANDTVINVTFNSNFVYGSQILVRAVGCGTSAARSLTITGTAASTPGSITGPTNACEYMVSSTIPNGNIATYIIRKVSGVSSYNWTAPANATIVNHPAGLGVNDTFSAD